MMLKCLTLMLVIVVSWQPNGGFAEEPKPFWDWSAPGKIRHQIVKGGEPAVLNMQGQYVVMETHVDASKGLEYKARFFNIADPDKRMKVVFDGGSGSLPTVVMGERPRPFFQPVSVDFDGRLIVRYRPYRGVALVRTVYPSLEQPMVIEEWECRNSSNQAVLMKVLSARKVNTIDDAVTVGWECPKVDERLLQSGEVMRFYSHVQARVVGEKFLDVDVDGERVKRLALSKKAWAGSCQLDVPDEAIVAAYNFQKLHVLETPIQTRHGLITHNGSLTYSPGIWANDPVEYSSPLFPFFGDETLNEASMNMYRIWLKHCREQGIDPFPGSFEYESLRLVQKHRGDDAMVLYGLSKFLLFQGDRKSAEELWPLIEFSVKSIEAHMTKDGVVASKTDEMEGRYPTGLANLSTSTLAYGGYRHAAVLARALGKQAKGEVYDQRAVKLAAAIERYFGAEVEGFTTYQYYQGNKTLRGWILLPLAMGIREREKGTLQAMLSDKLWPSRNQGGDILAESTRDTEWGRETYYALRVLFNAGRANTAADLSRKVVTAQMFGPKGPYPDEDAIDMLCPGSLYPRVFTEGAFGIVPTGLDSFSCTPWLPDQWPMMALRDARAFGASWHLIVKRKDDALQVDVVKDGKVILSQSGAPGTTYQVDLSQ